MPDSDIRSLLHHRQILLGISGGIACYKSAELVRRLKEYGADVRVVMTDGARAFVNPLTFQAVSGNPVHSELLDEEAEAGMGHIELARWADLILIAPATANFIERLAQGRGDDLLTTLCLASIAPIKVAPAMNQAMWSNAATQNNIRGLRNRKIDILGPGVGSQACGDMGAGRMLEPMDIVSQVANGFARGPLTGKKVVITAGPTLEAMDPVRFISNHSSGKMGYALASAAASVGARVILISGPVSLPSPTRVELHAVKSAEQMREMVMANIDGADLFIGTAAVADYRPLTTSPEKIKKNAETMTIELVRNPDILNEVSHLTQRPFTVGFAAESEKLLEHARAKLERKSLDLIVANDISRADIGFGCDENEVYLLSSDTHKALPKCSKAELAKLLIAEIQKFWLSVDTTYEAKRATG